MRKIDKHFSISPDLDNKIKISLKKSKRSYSDELNFIINEYFKEKEELEKILISLDSDMKFVARKMNILFELVKQIYSDMELEKPSWRDGRHMASKVGMSLETSRVGSWMVI